MFQNQLQRVTPEIRKDAERELQRWQEKRLAPPPLDEYMRKPYHPPTMTSPPSRPIHPSNLGDTHVLKGKTPVQPSSAIVQAETLLKRVQTSRKYLESNLEVIQRSKREQEFQEVIESMYADGDAAERAQIKLLVDDYIALVDSQVKEELLHYNSNLAFSPPTKLPPDKHQNPLAAETHKTSKPPKKKVSAKVDTGLRKSKEAGDGKPIKDITATGNETREKLKEKKSVTKRGSAVSSKFPVKDHQNNRNFSSIYGRNLLQQSQRTTLRDAPYLRIANKSPQTKRQRMSPKKDAASKQTTHTQTPSGTTEKRVSLLHRFPPETSHSSIKQNQSYIFQNYLDSPEILRETAIPLREPQVGGERTEPMVIFNQLDIPPSNQLKQNNVAVISMVTQKPQLEIKHLPPVDIDTEVSSMSEDQGAPVLLPPQLEEIKTQDLLDDQYQEHKEQDADSDKDDIPESLEVLSFQGYGEYQGEYHGPAFPPQTPHQHQERRSEDTAADLGRKGLLEHRAMEWIEQELMAKMISEFHSRLPRPKQRTDCPESDKHDPVDAIGSGGLQLFVDVGQPVNPGLVSSLVKEVLEEDIAKMLGQHLRSLSDGDTSIPATDQRPHSQAAEVPNQELIHTPEVTPPHSPFHSPSPVLHEGQIKTPEATASDISQEAEAEPEETPEEEDNLIQGPTSPVGTPPMTPPPSKPGLTPEPGHVETPPPSFHENPPLLLEDTGTVGTPSLTIEESPPASPVKVKETPEQSPIPSLPLEREATPSPTLPSSPRREVTPPPSTQSSSSSTTEDITATETSGREISAGEWLISQQSEGQVPKALMQSTFLDGTSLQEGAEASQTTSSDTLIETEELENDIAQDQEEGEIRGDVKLADIRDPMVAILTKLNQLPGGYYLPGQVVQAITRGNPSNSPGEVSEGQRPVMAPGVGEHLKRIGSDDTNLPQSPGEVSLPKEGDIYNREPGETPRIIVKSKTDVPFKDSTLRLSQLNSRSSSSENGEKETVKDDKGGTFSSDEGGEEEKEEVLGLQIAAPRIIQVGSHQSPREAESPKQREPPDRRQPNLDLFGTHNMSDQEVRPRTLTPDAINMEALLQSGYLSQTFSQSDGGPPLGSLVGQKGTLGGNESGGTLRQTGGALGTTFGTTMTEDSLEVAAAKKVPLEPQQKKFSITLPSTSNIEEEKLDWSHTESETGNQTVSDVSEISAGDL